MNRNSDRYRSVSDLPETLPIFPLPGAVLLPGGDLPLNIFEPRYLEMVSSALSGDRMIGMIQPREIETETDLMRSDGPGELYDIGCAGRITSFVEAENNQVQIILTGICRFRIVKELETATPFRLIEPAYGEFKVDLSDENNTPDDVREDFLDNLKQFLEKQSIEANWDEIRSTDTATLVNTLTMIGSFSASEKQALLEAPDLGQRIKTLIALASMSSGTSSDSNDRTLQ